MPQTEGHGLNMTQTLNTQPRRGTGVGVGVGQEVDCGASGTWQAEVAGNSGSWMWNSYRAVTKAFLTDACPGCFGELRSLEMPTFSKAKDLPEEMNFEF